MNKQYTDGIMKLGGPKKKKKKTLHPSFVIFPPFVNTFPFPKLPSTKHWQYQSPLSKMWLVFYLESIPDSCDSCQQTRKEATTELLSNEKFIVSFVSLLCFNLRIALANFTADEPSTSLLDDYSS